MQIPSLLPAESSFGSAALQMKMSRPARLQALAFLQAPDVPAATNPARDTPAQAWRVAQRKQGRAKPASHAENTSNACSCPACQAGGQHISRLRFPPASLSQAPIQRMAIPNGDPNAGVTAELTTIETAAANPANQTVNNANDVVAAANAPVLPNPGARETYGLARYPDGLFALGSQAFADAAGATRLGARAPREHAEISFIVNRGAAPTSVWSTQDCCLFCFGYLDAQNIPHLPLRANPFPQAWTHPTQGWQIVRRVPLGGRPHWVITAPDGTTATYLPAEQPAEKPKKRKKKIDPDSDPKKKDPGPKRQTTDEKKAQQQGTGTQQPIVVS